MASLPFVNDTMRQVKNTKNNIELFIFHVNDMLEVVCVLGNKTDIIQVVLRPPWL